LKPSRIFRRLLFDHFHQLAGAPHRLRPILLISLCAENLGAVNRPETYTQPNCRRDAPMSLEAKLKKQLTIALDSVDQQGTHGPRLVDNAKRLWKRIEKFAAMDLVAEPDMNALELACYAMQLPMRQSKPPSSGKLGRTNLRERAEQAAELLVTLFAGEIDEDLLDRATRLLHETPHRPPVMEDARLLADAVNLDDFGITGLIVQMIQLARQGGGVMQLADAWEKREEYGYWEARLKDGFHFEPVRQIAKRRLARARQMATMLAEELKED
jgi:hypothetical protein